MLKFKLSIVVYIGNVAIARQTHPVSSNHKENISNRKAQTPIRFSIRFSQPSKTGYGDTATKAFDSSVRPDAGAKCGALSCTTLTTKVPGQIT